MLLVIYLYFINLRAFVYVKLSRLREMSSNFNVGVIGLINFYQSLFFNNCIKSDDKELFLIRQGKCHILNLLSYSPVISLYKKS